MTVYPNPTSDTLTFSQETAKIQIYDISGKLMRTFTNTAKIRINDLPAGTYIIRMKDQNGIMNLEKVIKQ